MAKRCPARPPAGRTWSASARPRRLEQAPERVLEDLFEGRVAPVHELVLEEPREPANTLAEHVSDTGSVSSTSSAEAISAFGTKKCRMLFL